MEFLSTLYDKCLSISLIKSAKNATAQYVCIPPYKHLSEHPLMNKYLKGLFNLRPPKPKFRFIWDVKTVFDFFRGIPENRDLDDTLLTYKMVMLLILLGGQRVDTIFWFRVNEMFKSDISITFAPDHVLKQSRSGRKLDTFEYKSI